ncbi:MAG: hypothetical protein AAF573_01355 [Bacteroidota bacterium]
MQHPFKNFPVLYYQIFWIFVVSQIAFYAIVFDNSAYIMTSPSFDLGIEVYNVILVLVNLLYPLAGYFIDRQSDVRNGLLIGLTCLGVGLLIAFVGPQEHPITYFSSYALSLFGNGIIYILCVMHVGVIFPVANDWKDNAFILLLFSPVFFMAVLAIALILFSESTFYTPSEYHLVIIIKIGLLIGLGALIVRSRDLGFQIKNETETEEEENAGKIPFLQNLMIVMIFVATVFYFMVKNLPNLAAPESYGGLEELIEMFGGENNVGNILAMAGIFTVAGILLYTPKYRSIQVQKIKYITFAILLLGLSEFLAAASNSMVFDAFLSNAYAYLYSFIFIPTFMSIITHVNLDQDLGFWIGALIGVPYFIDEALSNLKGDWVSSLPYIALLMTVLFAISLRENQKMLTEKLALDEPNQIEEEENKVDPLDHFIEE